MPRHHLRLWQDASYPKLAEASDTTQTAPLELPDRVMPRSLLSALAVVACLAAVCAQVAAQARFDFDTAPGNLPKTVVPVRYVLALDLDPARDGFTGRADIVIEVRQPVEAVVLHAHHLTASRADLRRDGRTRSLHVAPGPIGQSWA